MLKHLLMDPAFPDLVADWAAIDQGKPACRASNDDRVRKNADSVDPLAMLGKLEIAATRLW